MKVYNWKTLLVTLFLGGAAIVYSIVQIKNGEEIGWIWLGLFCYCICEALYSSLTAKGYQKNLEKSEKCQEIYKDLFGKFAPVAPFGALICMVISLILLKLFPTHVWPCMIFLIAAVIYQICLSILIRGEMKNRE